MTLQWNIRDESFTLPPEVVTKRGAIRFHYQRLTEGVRRDVALLTVEGKSTKFAIIPTRGMGIWKAWHAGVEFGWKSPVQGPVHPQFVPVQEPSGLGWLEGFDELVVRCGLRSNGAPEFDAQGRLKWPLHGRIANLPAESLQVLVDEQEGWVEVTGILRETQLFFANLQLTSRVRMDVDGNVLTLIDEVTNLSALPAGHQMLYHINVGAPVLGAGAKLYVTADEVAPRNAHSAKDVDRWQEYLGPTTGYVEQVYFMKARADTEGWASAVLVSADGGSGLGVQFDTHSLPYFIQWKNSAAVEDGYVTGLEPATNFPNMRSHEERQGRVVNLMPGGSITHRVKLHLLGNPATVSEFAKKCQSSVSPRLSLEPRADWS